MKNKILTLLLSSFAIAANAELKIQPIIDSVLSHNSELSTMRTQIAAEKAAFASTNNLADPEVEFSHQWGQKGIGNKWGVEASQSFDWPGLYSARTRANEAALQAMEAEYLARRNELAYEVRCAITDGAFAMKKVELIERRLQLYDSLQVVFQNGADKGEISILDVNKLKIERLRLKSRYDESWLSFEEAYAKLTTLAGGLAMNDVSEFSDYPEMQLLSSAVYIERAKASSPDLAYARSLNQAENVNLDVVKKSGLPGFTVGYTHEYEMGDHFNGFKVGVTLPLFSNRHKRAEIMARKEVIADRIRGKESEIEGEIKGDCRTVNALDREIAAYRDVLKSNDNPRLLKIAYEARHISLMDFLLEMNYFIEAEESLIDLQLRREQIMNRLLRY